MLLMVGVVVVLAATAALIIRPPDVLSEAIGLKHGGPWNDPPGSHPGAYVAPDGHWCEPTLPGHPLSGYDCSIAVPAGVPAPPGVQDQRQVKVE
jgi:hypothetical protein